MELEGLGSLLGYRAMWSRLRSRYKLWVHHLQACCYVCLIGCNSLVITKVIVKAHTNDFEQYNLWGIATLVLTTDNMGTFFMSQVYHYIIRLNNAN